MEFVWIILRRSIDYNILYNDHRRKKEARAGHEHARYVRKIHGLKSILHSAKRYKEKAAIRKEYVVFIIYKFIELRNMKNVLINMLQQMLHLKELFLLIYLIVKVFLVQRFSVIQLSKREKKKLVNGQFLYPKYNQLQMLKCSVFFLLVNVSKINGSV